MLAFYSSRSPVIFICYFHILFIFPAYQKCPLWTTIQGSDISGYSLKFHDFLSPSVSIEAIQGQSIEILPSSTEFIAFVYLLVFMYLGAI